MEKPVEIFIEPGRIVTNDNRHGPHGPDNPDDGEISPFALALGQALKELGMEVHVSRLD